MEVVTEDDEEESSYMDDVLPSEGEELLTHSMEVETESDEEEGEFEADKLSSPRGFFSPTAEDIAEEENELTGLSQTFSSRNLRQEYRRLLCLGKAHRHEKAEGYFWSAKSIAEEIGDLSLEAQAEIGLGNAYCAAKNNEEGLKYFSKALKIAPTQELRNKAFSGQEKAKSFIKRKRR